MTPIRPWLYIGKYRDLINQHTLVINRIGAILQFAEPMDLPEVESLYLPVEDAKPLPAEFIKQGVTFAREHKRLGHTVLIACGAGINRSTVFTIAVLKEEENLTLLEAWRMVKRLHIDAQPHLPLWQSLCQYYQEDSPYEVLLVPRKK